MDRCRKRFRGDPLFSGLARGCQTSDEWTVKVDQRRLNACDVWLSKRTEQKRRSLAVLTKVPPLSLLVQSVGDACQGDQPVSVQQLAMISEALSDSGGGQFNISNVGPKKAAAELCMALPTQTSRCDWALSARVEAVVGSCKKSLPSAKSGMRAWITFFRDLLGKTGSSFPPELDDLLAWSRLFQHEGTFCNYVAYVRLGCEIVGAPIDVFGHPSVKRAKTVVAKRGLAVKRTPRFIRQQIFVAMALYGHDVPAKHDFVMLALISYVFLLRVPCECLPMAFHERPQNESLCPVLFLDEEGGVECLELYLPRRKNRKEPIKMIRTCWCMRCPNTCPVHVVGEFLRGVEPGVKPFAAWWPGMVLSVLREVLKTIGVDEAEQYVAHDLRRGHADDLLRRGATLLEILRAGD